MAHTHVNEAVPIWPETVTSGAIAANGILFPSASRAVATYNSVEHYNPFARGIRIFTTNDAAGGGTATVKIQVRTPASGAFTDLTGATTAALGAVTGSILTVYPGLTGIANNAGIEVNQHLGLIWRAVLTIGTATVTCSVEADYLL